MYKYCLYVQTLQHLKTELARSKNKLMSEPVAFTLSKLITFKLKLKLKWLTSCLPNRVMTFPAKESFRVFPCASIIKLHLQIRVLNATAAKIP